MEPGVTSCHSLHIHPGRINAVFQSLIPSKYPRKKGVQPGQFKNRFHNGKVSLGMKRKLTREIEYGLYISKPKKFYSRYSGKVFTSRLVAFDLTLPSPQVHPDQVITERLLGNFLRELRRKWKAPWYIWVAEKAGNDRIHYHFIVGIFIPHNELQNVWNRICNNLGYVDEYRKLKENQYKYGFYPDPNPRDRASVAVQLKRYRQSLKVKWANPPSVHIDAVHHVGNIRSYFIGYMTKPEQKAGVTSRLHGCSVNLSNHKGATADTDGPMGEELWKIQDSGRAYVIHARYYSVFFINIDLLKELGCPILYNRFREYIREKFPEQYPPELF